MFFGFDPFTMLGLNEQPRPPRPQNRQLGQENIFDQFANFLNNGFMNPQPQPQPQGQHHNHQNNERRPGYYKPKKNEEKK